MAQKKLVGSYFIIYLKEDPKRQVLDIKVNRQIKGAVIRNRIKRVLREFFRVREQNRLLASKTVVCIARPEAGKARKNELYQDLSAIFD